MRELVDWILRHAERRPEMQDYITELGPRLAASELSVDRLSFARIPIFAAVDGIQYLWSADKPGEVGVIERPSGFLGEDEHLNSPLHWVWEHRQPLRAPLREPVACNALPFLSDLRDQGFTDYLAVPLDAGDSCSHILSLATRSAHGFRDEVLSEARALFTVLGFIAEAEDAKRLKQLAGRDGLTGLANRRAFDLYLRQSWCTCSRGGMPLSLILFDIDNFKAVNDQFGHNTGDRCIQKVAESAVHTIRRDDDLAARIGGEEFAILLPGSTPQGASQLAESLRETVSQSPWQEIFQSSERTLTVSLGVGSIIPEPRTCQQTFLATIDEALYAAKQNGRNRVISKEWVTTHA